MRKKRKTPKTPQGIREYQKIALNAAAGVGIWLTGSAIIASYLGQDIDVVKVSGIGMSVIIVAIVAAYIIERK
jgi:hypothetical protein